MTPFLVSSLLCQYWNLLQIEYCIQNQNLHYNSVQLGNVVLNGKINVLFKITLFMEWMHNSYAPKHDVRWLLWPFSVVLWVINTP